MKRIILIIIAIPLLFQISFGQKSIKDQGFEKITESLISAQLEFLSSDWTQGRELGTAGAYMSADYIASMFKTFGLEPGGDITRKSNQRRSRFAPPPKPRKKTYFQNFNLLEYRSSDVQKVSIVSKSEGALSEIVLDQGADFSVIAGTRAISIESDLVFVGYGLNNVYYNDFEDIDVRNKVIVRLVGFPGHRNPDSELHKKFGSDRTSAYYKDISAAEAGAAAVIEIRSTGSSFRATPKNVPIRYNEANWEGTEPFRNSPRKRFTQPDNISSGLTKITVADHVLSILMNGVDFELEEFENTAEKNQKPNSRPLKGKMIKVETSVESQIIQARNVVGVLEGKNKDTCIVIGAHYDHLGQIRNFIYNGADDNASGTVGIMTIAKSMVETGIIPEYTLVFCAWTGEEKGLIGSRYFANNPIINNIKCYMNYDMISRTAPDDPDKNKCDFQFTNTVPILREITENHINDYKVNLDIKYNGSPKPRGGSDFRSFSAKDIPIFLFHGKFTPDYHQYTDHSDKAELTYMRDIIRMGYLNIFELSTKTW